MSEGEVKNYPKCGKPLLSGRISAISDWLALIYWKDEKKKRAELLHPFFIQSMKASRCEECGIVIAYEKDEKEIMKPVKPTPKSFLKNCVECVIEIPIASDYCPKCGATQKKKKRGVEL